MANEDSGTLLPLERDETTLEAAMDAAEIRDKDSTPAGEESGEAEIAEGAGRGEEAVEGGREGDGEPPASVLDMVGVNGVGEAGHSGAGQEANGDDGGEVLFTPWCPS